MRTYLIGFAALLIVAAGAGWYFYAQRQPVTAEAAADITPAVSDPAADTTPENAVPSPAPSDPPLPALADSDPVVNAALVELIGADSARQLLKSENLIRQSVATVDNLPRRKLSIERLPWIAAPGRFEVVGDDDNAVISEQNYRRYDAAFAVLERVDATKLAALYVRFYPLAQRAYQDLGYPDGYFNDRFIKVIDHLLATPRPREPIALKRPNVFYEFADPALESLSGGQKLLLRIGPKHRGLLETRLRELRGQLARVQ
jgi:hypothetical protein